MNDMKFFSNRKLRTEHFAIGMMFVLTFLTGLVYQQLLSFGIIICCTILLFRDKLFLAFPFIIFYNSFYGLLFGVSVLRLYTILVFFNLIFRFSNNHLTKIKYFLPFFVYTLYLLTVMLPNGYLQALYILSEILCCFIIVSDLTTKTNVIYSFFKIYVVVCFCSYFTGMIYKNTIGGIYDYIRFNGTFEDPNYMGFFFTVAVFATVTLELFHKKIRYVVVALLYVMLLTTLSMTAIVVNIAVWFFYLVIMKKIRLKSVVIIALIICAAISLFSYGIENPDTPMIGDLSSRIDEKFQSFLLGDINSVTTGRTNLASNNMKYYLSKSWNKILFGGIPVNSRYIHPDLHGASHNEYVDILLNVGVVGAVIMFGYFLTNMFLYIRKYHEMNDKKYLFFTISKVVWLCYAMGLTMFIDYRFMLIFLI